MCELSPMGIGGEGQVKFACGSVEFIYHLWVQDPLCIFSHRGLENGHLIDIKHCLREFCFFEDPCDQLYFLSHTRERRSAVPS